MITEEIAVSFSKKNDKAFDAVYKAYAPSMFGICLRYTSCRDDAQEILQESFIKVYENCHTYDPTRSIKSWIKTITIRTALNYLKVQKRMVLKDDDLIFENFESLDEDIETDDIKKRQEILIKVLNLLPDGYRTIFNLSVLDNLTHKEIAEYLSISEGTSKSQLFKAKKMIQELLQKELIVI